MKKALKAELHNLAIQILKLESTEDISKLKKIAGDVYDKLNILEFAEHHFDGTENVVGKKDVMNALESPDAEEVEAVEKQKKPIVETIEQETQSNIKIEPKPLSTEEQEYNDRQKKLEALEAKTYMKNDMADIGGVSYDDLPQFEPVATQSQSPDKQLEKVTEIRKTNNTVSSSTKKSKSLNEQLNKGIKIGLNDRLAFIKHLFDGNAEDYNRVLSQLNTHSNVQDASNFLETVVKPDYNNWNDKELYADRFKEVIEKRFS